MTKRKKNFKIGDVFQIALPSGRFAYGRVYRDASVGIYSRTSTRAGEAPVGSRDFMFHVGMYQDILRSGECPIVAHDAFKEDESDWPPPYCVEDPISQTWSIYHQGEFRPASREACQRLERAAAWDLHHIIERLEKEIEDRSAVQ